MKATEMSRLWLGAMCICGIAATMPSPVTAQTSLLGRYTAIAVSLNGGPVTTGAGKVLLTIDKLSTEQDRAKLISAFQKDGPDKLLDVLKDSPIVGSFRLPSTIAWDLRYAYETPLPDGGRRLILATDRRISFQEAASGGRSNDYPFSLIEIHFDKNGKGSGTYSVATKISLSKDKKTVELENYGREPMRLTEVIPDK